MPINPDRKDLGGDVEGAEATNPGLGLSIDPLKVSKASYDAGYRDGVGADYDVTNAELKQGYASYGRKKVGQ